MKLLYIYIVTAALMLAACKKYNYDFEHGYPVYTDSAASISVDTSAFGTDSSLYSLAKVFPGLVTAGERSISDTAITFDMSYGVAVPEGLSAATSPLPLFSTGLYNVPGEYIQINVPAGVFGLTAIVGSHLDNLTGTSNPRRSPVISNKAALFPGTNFVRNLFGGYIWLQPNGSRAAPITLHFKNVVRASDYALGSTDFNIWKNEVLASGVPWLEFQSKQIAFSFQKDMVVRSLQQGTLDNIGDVMEEWDKIITEDLFGWAGVPVSKLKYRAVLDIQPQGTSDIHGPQPIVAQNNTYWFGEWTNLDKLKTASTAGIYTFLVNGLKQTNDVWWSDITTVGPVLFKFKTALRNGRFPDLTAEGDINYQADTAVRYALNYNIGKHLGKDPIAQNAIFGAIPFLQVFDKLSNPATGENGWTFMTYWLKLARSQTFWNASNIGKTNFFYQALSDFTQRDCFNFLDAWGIPVNDYYRSVISQKYPPLEKAVWGYNPITKTGGDGTPPRRQIHDRTGWEASASSFNVNGEIAYPEYIIDGDPDTYWHSCYNGCAQTTQYPVYLWVDMKEAKNVTGVYFRQRMNRNIRNIQVGVSNDGTNYTNLLSFDLPNIAYRQYFAFPSMQNVRYLRITVNSGWDGSAFTALSEFGTYYDY